MAPSVLAGSTECNERCSPGGCRQVALLGDPQWLSATSAEQAEGALEKSAVLTGGR
ncbi:Hypothetical predicted protein, partial [Pelobates cultripes]